MLLSSEPPGKPTHVASSPRPSDACTQVFFCPDPPISLYSLPSPQLYPSHSSILSLMSLPPRKSTSTDRPPTCIKYVLMHCMFHTHTYIIHTHTHIYKHKYTHIHIHTDTHTHIHTRSKTHIGLLPVYCLGLLWNHQHLQRGDCAQFSIESSRA